MNMVRIRRILDMRKELKAPPLLPPRIKNKSLECSDKNSHDIVIFHFQLRNTILTLTEPVILSIHESESGGREGPWKTIALSEQFFLCTNELNDLPALFSTEFEFEIIQRMKIELCMGSNDSFVSIGSSFFTISQVINNRRLTVPLLSTSGGGEISVVDISSSIQFSPPPFQIQLEFHDLHRKYISDTSMLNLTVNEARKGKEIYRSEPQKSGNRIIWRPFVLSIQHEMEVIVITVLHRDEKSKNDICIGESQTTINQLERDSIEGRVYQMIRKDDKKEGRRSNGLLEVIRVTPLPIKSFLQLITTGTSLHISFAIDFSSTQDDFSPLFSTEPEFILRSIGNCIEDYVNKSISALGFGAKLPPIDRESQQFCLSLNTNPYCESIDGVINFLHRCIHTIRPSKNSHLSHVIYYASKMAIHANLKRSRDNTQYFILVILTRGIIDDLKEVVQAVIFASKAPISIIFVGMGESNKDELAQLGKGGTRISYQGRRVTRDILHFVDVNSINRNEMSDCEKRNNLCEVALSRVVPQLTAFLSKMTSTSRTSSRQFGSMTSMESEETEENDRRSRLEQFRISMNDCESDEGRVKSSQYRKSQRSFSCLEREVRAMSIASEEPRGLCRAPND